MSNLDVLTSDQFRVNGAVRIGTMPWSDAGAWVSGADDVLDEVGGGADEVVLGKQRRVYFGGDSGYFDGFKEIGDRWHSGPQTLGEPKPYDIRDHPPEDDPDHHRVL